MKKFKVIITQEIENVIEIEAKDHDEAYWKAMDLWQNCEEPFEIIGEETTHIETIELKEKD